MAYSKQCEERAQKFIYDVIHTENQPFFFEQLLTTIHDAIKQDKILIDEDGDEDDPQFRVKIYVRIQLELIQNTMLSPTVRTAFLDILGEGLVNDNTMWMKQHILRFLARYLCMEDKACMSRAFMQNLEKAAENNKLMDKNMVLCLGFSNASSLGKILGEYSIFLPSELFLGLPNSPNWGCVLIRARRGENRYIKKMLKLAENETPVERCRLFEDMTVVHQDACVNYLYEYLISDKRLPPLRTCDPGNLMGGFAACALAKMLEGFPECKEPYFYKTEDLEPYRKWMKEQKTFKFRKTNRK